MSSIGISKPKRTRILLANFNSIPAGQNNHFVKQPERMAIDGVSGALTIRNLEAADEDILTCLFTHSKEYVSSVHLKIKGKHTYSW